MFYGTYKLMVDQYGYVPPGRTRRGLVDAPRRRGSSRTTEADRTAEQERGTRHGNERRCGRDAG